MGRTRYSNMSELAGLGFLHGAMEGRTGGDGDIGAGFPRTDAEDLSRGAQFIPSEVTMARQAGKKVNFVTECNPNCWYWEMPDSSRIYHFDRMTYDQIGTTNGRKVLKEEYGTKTFEGGPGPCPECGNINTSGGTIKKS